MKLTTAGESHGKALVAIIEGLPAHIPVATEKINAELKLRQSGFGRGGRQKIESDRVEILAGVRNGETLGSPVALCIYNRDYAAWESVMNAEACDEAETRERALTRARPGHADLAGALKYAQTDARNIAERASARETAIRVAAGSVYKQYLAPLGVEIASYVREICDIKDGGRYAFNELSRAKTSPVGMLDPALEKAATERIAALEAAGDTAGGIVEVRVKGLKCGFGSPMRYRDKLDSRLAGALVGVQAVKGVEFGLGFEAARRTGKDVHDEIFYREDVGYTRETNRAGGIEGGTSNGEEIVVRVAMKPIPTLASGLRTVDLRTKEETTAASERSDVCAIFAFSVIVESVVAEVIANAVAERLGGDTLEQVKERYERL